MPTFPDYPPRFLRRPEPLTGPSRGPIPQAGRPAACRRHVMPTCPTVARLSLTTAAKGGRVGLAKLCKIFSDQGSTTIQPTLLDSSVLESCMGDASQSRTSGRIPCFSTSSHERSGLPCEEGTRASKSGCSVSFPSLLWDKKNSCLEGIFFRRLQGSRQGFFRVFGCFHSGGYYAPRAGGDLALMQIFRQCITSMWRWITLSIRLDVWGGRSLRHPQPVPCCLERTTLRSAIG